MPKKKHNWLKSIRHANLAFSFGATMLAAVFLGFYGGWWLDRRLNTFPLFMLLGIFLGVGAGFYSLWTELTGLTEKKPKEKPERGNDEQRD